MKQISIRSHSSLSGNCSVPGDKSISHRAVIFASIAEGRSYISNFLDGEDCRSTLAVMRDLGVRIDAESPTELLIHGRGVSGLQEPSDVLNCGKSDTTFRLLVGLLAGQRFTSFISGTEQLRRRPVDRVVKPLRMMGANLLGRQEGMYAPVAIAGSKLRGMEFDLPITSAQVKCCILLGSLYAHGLTIIRQSGPIRDHTERLLSAMGAPIVTLGRTIHSERPSVPLKPLDLQIPGDISSAAYLLVAAATVPDSRLTVTGIGVNRTRSGLVDALTAMGANIVYKNEATEGGEPVADVEVRYSQLQGITLSGEQVLTMIDELPIFAVAASQAKGRTVVRDASELRMKESDRIATTVSELRKMGIQINPTDDGFVIEGPTSLKGAPVESHGDHRLAIAVTIAGLLAEGTTTVYGAEVIDDSFPNFDTTLQVLGARLAIEEASTTKNSI